MFIVTEENPHKLLVFRLDCTLNSSKPCCIHLEIKVDTIMQALVGASYRLTVIVSPLYAGVIQFGWTDALV